MGNVNNRRRKRAKPISLHPLQPEQVLAGLMQVKPEPKPEEEPKAEKGKPQHKG